jgi:hypothetical protein
LNREKQIRDYAARYGYSIRKIPNHGGVKLVDAEGNERICSDLFSAESLIRIYKDEPLTSPVYEVGEKELKARLQIAAKDGEAAKRKYRNTVRMMNPNAVLTAKKVIRREKEKNG